MSMTHFHWNTENIHWILFTSFFFIGWNEDGSLFYHFVYGHIWENWIKLISFTEPLNSFLCKLGSLILRIFDLLEFHSNAYFHESHWINSCLSTFRTKTFRLSRQSCNAFRKLLEKSKSSVCSSRTSKSNWNYAVCVISKCTVGPLAAILYGIHANRIRVTRRTIKCWSLAHSSSFIHFVHRAHTAQLTGALIIL